MSLGNSVKSYHAKDSPIQGYINKHYQRLAPVQKNLLDETFKHAGFRMVGAPEVIQLGQNLIKSIQGKRVLDIGTYTGFSALGWALAIPDDGQVITFDVNEETVNIGKPHWKEAGVEHKIVSKIGPAVAALDELLIDQAGTFDFAFIDADQDTDSSQAHVISRITSFSAIKLYPYGHVTHASLVVFEQFETRAGSSYGTCKAGSDESDGAEIGFRTGQNSGFISLTSSPLTDKENYVNYYNRLKKLLRPGGIIAIDNALWSGKVADPNVSDPETDAIRAVNELAGSDDTVDASLLNIADGLALIFKPHNATY